MTYKVIEGEVPQLIQTFANIFYALTDALMRYDYQAYFMLVDQLETMSIFALSSKDRENIRTVKKIIRDYIRHLSSQFDTNSEFKEVEEEMQKSNEFDHVRDIVMYPLKRLISRVCISALSGTMMRRLTPPNASDYKFEDDLQDTLKEIAFKLEEIGLTPLEVGNDGGSSD